MVMAVLTRRVKLRHYDNFTEELKIECPHLYKNLTKFGKDLLNKTVERVKSHIKKQYRFWREPPASGVHVATGHHP